MRTFAEEAGAARLDPEPAHASPSCLRLVTPPVASLPRHRQARNKAEAAEARAELARSEPHAVANPRLNPVEPSGTSAFGKHQAKVAAQAAEIAHLKEQVEHLSFILSSSAGVGRAADAAATNSIATSPMKPSRAPLRPVGCAALGAPA